MRSAILWRLVAVAAFLLPAAHAQPYPQDLSDLACPVGSSWLTTAVGNGERFVLVEATETFTIVQAGIEFDPLLGGATDIRLNIWSVVPYPAGAPWPWKKDKLLSSTSTGIKDAGHPEVYYVELPFTFEKGKLYAIGFEEIRPNKPGIWGWGQYRNTMRFWSFDPANKGYAPYVVGGRVKVLDGGFDSDFKNRNLPHVVLVDGALTLYTIPVIVNYHPDVALPAGGAAQAVQEASKILKQADATLALVDVQSLRVDENGDGVADNNDDGAVDDIVERGRVRNAGQAELNARLQGKGLKIHFMNSAGTDTHGNPTAGVSVHRNPTVIQLWRGTAELTGEVMAHEIAHILTLSDRHKIDEKPAGTDRFSDADGHVPTAGADADQMANLMWPVEGVGHHVITAPQAARIYRDAEGDVRGYAAEARSAAAKKQQQFGSQTDALGDQALPYGYLDLVAVTLYSSTSSPVVEGDLSVRESFTGTVSATYALALDVDNNPLTGFLSNLSLGIEYVVELTVSGTAGNYTAAGVVRNLLAGTARPLSPPPVVFAAREDNSGEILLRSLRFAIPKSLVGLDSTAATTVPVHVTALSSGLIADQLTVAFQLNWWTQQPTLVVTGDCVPVSGQAYGFQVSGLSPNAPFVVLLDGQNVYGGITDSSGSRSDAFLFPNLPVNVFYALTAQDQTTGKFGYSMTCKGP